MSNVSAGAAHDRVWHSRTHLAHRLGEKLRVVTVGGMNSALVEFEDGHRCVTSCFHYRRVTAGADRPRPVPPAG